MELATSCSLPPVSHVLVDLNLGIVYLRKNKPPMRISGSIFWRPHAQQRLMHHGLKPNNIIITEDLKLMMIGFGLSGVTSKPDSNAFGTAVAQGYGSEKLYSTRAERSAGRHLESRTFIL